MSIPVGTRVRLRCCSLGVGDTGDTGTIVDPKGESTEHSVRVLYDGALGARGPYWARIEDLEYEMFMPDTRDYLESVSSK